MESASQKLKKIRQEKGLSLEEVQKKTKIHLNILKAIEGDGITNLSPVYLKGLLKIYCKFLGVDPGEFIPDYKEPQSTVGILNIAKEKKEEFTSFFKTASGKLGTLPHFKKVKKVFIFTLIIVFLSISLFNLGKRISSKRKEYLAKNKSLTSQKAKVIIPTSEPQRTTQSLPKKDSPSEIRLGIRARENCWVVLKADGKIVFQRVLEKGRFESWQARQNLELSLGNAGVVELEVNGQIFSNLGRRGQALKGIVITKEGLKIPR